jgi:flagellar hook-associated protein 3 FlgL
MALTPTGFPPQPRQHLMARLAAELRARADTAREEAVTGRLADPARAAGGRVAEILGLEQALGETAQHREIIDLAAARAAAIQAGLGALREMAAGLATTGQQALESHLGVAHPPVSVAARQALEGAVSALNVSFGGRALFAGDAGDGNAVAAAADIMAAALPLIEAAPTAGQAYADLDTAFTAAGGLYDTTVYVGGSGDAPASEVAPGVRLAYAARADEPAVRALMRDLVALAAAFDPENAIPEAERRGLAERAIAGLRGNVEGLAAISARVGTAEERLATLGARHQAAEATLTAAHQRLAGRDQFEAATELTGIEAQLETAYLATARLARLSLASFLR